MNQSNDLSYVNNVLSSSEQNGIPLIYAMWGVVVLCGFVLLELKPESSIAYWVVTSGIGMAVSIALGKRSEQITGQRNLELGKRYGTHFGMTGICIFIAMFSGDYTAIFLITGLGYCLAGVHLERIMWLPGIVSIVCYGAVQLKLIDSFILIGIVFSLGLFIAAWATSRANKANKAVAA